MASIFPNGSIFSIATTFEAPVTITGISNANPAVATASAHGMANGDVIVLSSGWPNLDAAVARVANQTSGTFEIQGVDTTDTTRFPTSGGAGTATEVGGWIALSQITDSSTSGGEPNFYDWQYLEDTGSRRQRPLPDNPISMTLTMDYDPSLAWHEALLKAARSQRPHVFRLDIPNGSKIFYNVYVSFSGQPTTNINQNMQVSCSLSYANQGIQRYAS